LAPLLPPPLASGGAHPKDVGRVFKKINLWVAAFAAKNKCKTIIEVVALSATCISGSQSFDK